MARVRSSLLALVLLLAVTATAFANPAGRWLGKVSTPNGDFDLVFNFQVQGTTLTGGMSTPNGDLPLSEGKVDGNNVSFNLAFGDNAIAYAGTVTGDTMVLKSNWGGEDRELTLTRAPAQ